ncbi:MAG: bifunctional phosphoribosylaminoimidazolecarboxamide formyltransferase/IMP cyclohydrolase [Armatimonadia bacterium]
MRKIKRAIISVSDKSGVVDFAKALVDLGVEILSTGGTRRQLEEAGVPVRAVESYTGFPEIMDHRVVTLHPKVHGGLLAVRDKEAHMAEAEQLGIDMIDMLVVNLYPFQQTVAREGVTLAEAVENIDIGGPAMLRAAAKNHKYVACVCSPAFYDNTITEMRDNGAALSEKTRQKLALETFAHTGQYDAAIAGYMSTAFAEQETFFPKYFAPWYQKQGEDLRYGENPHQEAAVYAQIGAHEPGLARAQKLSGERELSFNNYLDLTAAMEAARDFDEPTAIVIKHLNPCGAASAGSIAEAFADAWSSDPISAFGGVLGFNRVVDVETAKMIGNAEYLQDVIAPRYREESGDLESTILAAFVEAVIAPGYEPEALEILTHKKNMRVMVQPDFAPEGRTKDFDLKKIPGGLVVQTPDAQSVRRLDLKVATKAQPTPEQLDSLLFADRVAKHVKSNAIVLVQGKRLVGCGAGQMSRVDSSIIAARKAGLRAAGSVLASDAMFPARDGLDTAAETGAVAIIQPGGSKRDEEVIQAANEHGLVMVMTGMRHFWH